MKLWEKWLRQQEEASTMTTEREPLSQVAGWSVTDEAVVNDKGGFFKVLGVRVQTTTDQREIRAWHQPAFEEVGGPGAIVLVITEERTPRILITAKAEPGNPTKGCVLLAPTVQTSWSNLQAVHGGKKPPHSELVTDDMGWTELIQDGGRAYHKVNKYGFVFVKDQDSIVLNPNDRWFTERELCLAIAAGSANEHLTQAFGLVSAMIRIRSSKL